MELPIHSFMHVEILLIQQSKISATHPTGYIMLQIYQQPCLKWPENVNDKYNETNLSNYHMYGRINSEHLFFSIGHLQWLHENSWKYDDWRSAVESVLIEKLENQTSCSSHHFDCTTTWMTDFSCLCGSFNFSQPFEPHASYRKDL